MKNNRRKSYLRNKKHLATLSKDIKMAKSMGAIDPAMSINEALLEMYEKQTGEYIFRTFSNWKKEGYKIKKGEHAFLIWTRPRYIKKNKDKVEDKDKNENEEEEYKYYGICYLFHAGQVEKIKE